MNSRRDVKTLLDMVQTRLPVETVRLVSELLLHGEWGVALEVICDQLYEYNITISMEEYLQAELAARGMNMSNRTYELLRQLVFDKPPLP